MPTREQIKKLLSLEPDDTFLLYAMGQDLANNDEHEDAIAYFDKTLAVDETYCYAYYFKAQSLIALGRTDEATSVLDLGLETARRIGDMKAASELDQLRSMHA